MKTSVGAGGHLSVNTASAPVVPELDVCCKLFITAESFLQVKLQGKIHPIRAVLLELSVRKPKAPEMVDFMCQLDPQSA